MPVAAALPRLTPALSRPIRSDVIAEQYNQMIKYGRRAGASTGTVAAMLSRPASDRGLGSRYSCRSPNSARPLPGGGPGEPAGYWRRNGSASGCAGRPSPAGTRARYVAACRIPTGGSGAFTSRGVVSRKSISVGCQYGTARAAWLFDRVRYGRVVEASTGARTFAAVPGGHAGRISDHYRALRTGRSDA